MDREEEVAVLTAYLQVLAEEKGLELSKQWNSRENLGKLPWLLIAETLVDEGWRQARNT